MVGCEPEEERQKVVALAVELGVGEKVLTLPYRSDMPAVLAACDIVVDASTSGTGLTGTIREAMAMERAVIASECAGNSELIDDRINGLLIPPGDPAPLVAALTALLADPDHRRRLGKAGRQRVARDFSLERKLDRLEELYSRVADRRSRLR